MCVCGGGGGVRKMSKRHDLGNFTPRQCALSCAPDIPARSSVTNAVFNTKYCKDMFLVDIFYYFNRDDFMEI